MTDIFLDNRHTRIYYSIVRRAQQRTLPRNETEEHHIIPKSFYRSYCDTGWLTGYHNAPENRVHLTPKEHWVCHRLLVRMTTGRALGKMAKALNHMRNTSKKRGQERRMTARSYEIAREQIKRYMSEVMTEHCKKPGVLESRSLSLKKAYGTPEARAKMSRVALEACARPEVWENRSRAQKAAKMRPEIREKNSALNHPRADRTVYVFSHVDGTVTHSTRYELQQQTGINFNGLFRRTRRKMSAKGWRITGVVGNDGTITAWTHPSESHNEL